MNFALSAILVFILLLPGATLLKSYYTSLKEKESGIYIPITDLLLRGLVFSVFFHAFALAVLKLCKVTPRLDLLYQVLNGTALAIENKIFNDCVLYFSFYNFILIVIAFFLAKAVKWIFQRTNLDINWYSFRRINYWFSIFSGRYLEANNVQGKQVKTDLICLEVLCEDEIVYAGFLHDFNYSPHKDQLENIILTSVKKRTGISEEKMTEVDPMPGLIGDFFLIPAAHIVNISIYYINLDKANNDSDIQKSKT